MELAPLKMLVNRMERGVPSRGSLVGPEPSLGLAVARLFLLQFFSNADSPLTVGLPGVWDGPRGSTVDERRLERA